MCDFLCVCVCVCLCVCLCWCVEMGCAEVWLKFVCVLCGLTMAAGKLFSMAIFAKKMGYLRFVHPTQNLRNS